MKHPHQAMFPIRLRCRESWAVIPSGRPATSGFSGLEVLAPEGSLPCGLGTSDADVAS